MNVNINRQVLSEDIRKVIAELEAVGESLDPRGRAEVICSRREKLPWERRSKRKGRTGKAVVSGWVIADQLAKHGTDPFALPPGKVTYVTEFLADEIGDAAERAFKSGRPEREAVKRALYAASEELAEMVREYITSGGLGANGAKWARRKERLVAAGYGLRKYGLRRGIWTGRFLNGIRHRWRRGYRPTAAAGD